jgi:hypothetical protein
VIGVVSAATAGAFDQPSGRPALGQAVADAPDIYLLLVDAYPGADTLANDFHFDNGPFTSRMNELGFELAADSHSNYTLTALTLASMFNHEPVQALIPDPPATAGAQLRRLDQVINDGSVLKEVRSLGYTVTAIPSQYTATDLHAVDEYLDSGEATDFELSFLDQGLLPLVARDQQTRLVLDQNRSRIVTAFDRLVALADEPSATPRLVFAHVMAPHRPIVFAADGTPVGDCSGDCTTDEDDVGTDPDEGTRAATRGQVQHVNDLVVQTVSHIVQANERPAVIVVFSDHGFRADWSDQTEMISNLFLARTPGHPGLFPNDTTLINVFPRILNAYAAANLPLATEESYWTNMATLAATGYLSFERVR